MPSHKAVIDPALVDWDFDPGEGIPNGASYQAAVIPAPVPAEEGAVVGLTDDRMFDLLASKLRDDFWKPVLDQLRGEAVREDTQEAWDKLAKASLYDSIPHNIYGNAVPGKLPDGTEVLGIIAFYTKHEGGNGTHNEKL